jgi:hypothetical protein
LTRYCYGYILIIDEQKGRIYQKLTTKKTMPRFDGTGPLGSGAGTGWGLGPCGAGMGWRGGGRGRRGLGRGFGRFSGYPYTPQITRKEEKEILTEEVNILEDELKEIKKRLSELKSKN